ALEAGTKADVFDGRVLYTELVGIGRDTRAVVRVAIRGIERQLFDASLALHQRNAGLHEEVVHVGRATDADRRSACTAQESVGQDEVRGVLKLVAAILDTERDLDRLFRPR